MADWLRLDAGCSYFWPMSRTEIKSNISYFCFLFQSKNMIMVVHIWTPSVKWDDIEKFSVYFLNKIVIDYLNHGSSTTNVNHPSLSFLIATTTASLCMCFYLPNKHNQSCSKLPRATKMRRLCFEQREILWLVKLTLNFSCQSSNNLWHAHIKQMFPVRASFCKSLDMLREINFRSRLHLEASKFLFKNCCSGKK